MDTDTTPNTAIESVEHTRTSYARLMIAALLSVALVLLYHDSWFTMARIWWVSDTFAHGMFILPLSAWLVYRMRDELRHLPIATDWIALPILVAVGLVWALARVADVQVVQQFAVVMMIPLLVLLVFGRQLVGAIAFPLGFLLLAVPVGEGLIPYLVDWTADFVVFALRLSGFAVFREGNNFSIPSGNWSVVTGCSGLRYLMATMTVGLLYAYLSYRAYWRRVVFFLVGIAVAVVGNWLRAYGIVMIAHLSGMKLALGVDHFIYGWVFFGILIFALMWFGALWREPELAASARPAARADGPPPGGALPALLAGLMVLLLAPALVHLANQRADALAGDRLVTVEPAGWSRTELWNTKWRPEQYGASQIVDERFSANAHEVGVFVAYYPVQRQGAELINARNRLLYEKDQSWKQVAGSRGSAAWGGTRFEYRESRIAARDGSSQLLIWHGWWAGGRFTTNAYRVKLYEALAALLGQGRRGAWVVLYTSTDEQPDAARARLSEFARAYGDAFTEMMQRTESRPPTAHPATASD